MSKYLRFMATFAAITLAACQSDRSITSPDTTLENSPLSATSDNSPGAVYSLMNQASGNAVAVFDRSADGSFVAAGSVATGGTGTGAGLGSQGALTLSDDGRWLFAVNAGSNDVSAFRVSPQGISLTSRTTSGGTVPISVTVHGNLVYVLNAGGAGNISGFTLDQQGILAPLASSTRPLSASGVGPAQVSFSPDGRALVVTEKATSRIDVYTVDKAGLPSAPTWYTSAGSTPFGFAFGHQSDVFVSEAAGSASSYALGKNGGLSLVSGVVPTNQGAPCWLVVTTNGRFAYTANAQGGSISGFVVDPRGALTLLDADGATALVGRGATDLALSGNSRYLYQLVGRNVLGFRIEADGHLTPVGSAINGLPAGSVGLAAR